MVICCFPSDVLDVYAQVVVGVLQGLSDTGIYRTLSLKRILEAAIQVKRRELAFILSFRS